VARCRMGSSPW